MKTITTQKLIESGWRKVTEEFYTKGAYSLNYTGIDEDWWLDGPGVSQCVHDFKKMNHLIS